MRVEHRSPGINRPSH